MHLLYLVFAAIFLLLGCGPAQGASELRLLTHASFALPKTLLERFEQESGSKLVVLKSGDAGEMLNKLILTKAHPIADVVFGLDNVLAHKAQAAGVLDALPEEFVQEAGDVVLQAAGVVAVDYGFVTLNYDKAWFARMRLPLPERLEDLTSPTYARLLVVQNPATSSPGLAFLLATIGALGEAQAFDWWQRMRANGLKVVKGWSEAYYTAFSHNGGTYPLVVSYATSPAAEWFYAKAPLASPPTGSLDLMGGVFRQVEGAALVAGGTQRAAALQFLQFLRSPDAQRALQTAMWMYPIDAGTPTDPALRHAPEPKAHSSPTAQAIAQRSSAWVRRWQQVVLK